jgi:hypothetical protein
MTDDTKTGKTDQLVIQVEIQVEISHCISLYTALFCFLPRRETTLLLHVLLEG